MVRRIYRETELKGYKYRPKSQDLIWCLRKKQTDPKLVFENIMDLDYAFYTNFPSKTFRGKPFSFKAKFVAFVNRQQLTGDVHVIRSLPLSLTGTWQKSSPVDVVLSCEDFSLIGTRQKYRFVPNNPATISHWKMEQFETVNPPNSKLVICLVHNDDDFQADKAKDKDHKRLMRDKKDTAIAEWESARATTPPAPCSAFVCVNDPIPVKRDEPKNSPQIEPLLEEIEELLMHESDTIEKEGFNSYLVSSGGRNLTLRIKKPRAELGETSGAA